MTAARQRSARLDAVGNRTALLDAASRLLLRDGQGVALEVVAREAGVGIATLYRNFTDRRALFAAVSLRSYQLVTGLARDAADDPAPALQALEGFFEAVISRRDQLALPLLGVPSTVPSQTQPLGDEISRHLGRVLDRGIADGTVRPDAEPTDVIVGGAVLAAAQLPAPAWDAVARRLARTLLDGLAARPGTSPLPAGLTRAQLDEAMGGARAGS